MNLADSEITGNKAAGSGGGIYNQGQLTVTGTRIARNTAATGGGGIDDDGSLVTVTLTSSAVSRNRPDNCEPASSIAGCTS